MEIRDVKTVNYLLPSNWRSSQQHILKYFVQSTSNTSSTDGINSWKVGNLSFSQFDPTILSVHQPFEPSWSVLFDLCFCTPPVSEQSYI